MDRGYELENLRRSIAMLLPGAAALDREQAMGLLYELQGLEDRLRSLRAGLRRLLGESEDPPPAGSDPAGGGRRLTPPSAP